MGGLIDVKWKGCELIIHDNDGDLRVTMLWWVSVRDSDQGDFRCDGAIDTSSCWCDIVHDESLKWFL